MKPSLNLFVKTLALAASTLLAGATWAAPAATGPYVELGAGLTHVNVDCAGTTRCDDSGRHLRLVGGYPVAAGWAVELGLADLGRIEAGGVVPGFGNVGLKARARSIGAGVATTLPLVGDWSLGLRLGVARHRTEIDFRAAGGSGTETSRNTAPYAGVGLLWQATPALALGVAVESTRVKYDTQKAAVATAGLTLRAGF